MSKKTPKKDPVIIIDTREKLPYIFQEKILAHPLKAGDYSLVGFQNQIAIERKTKVDAYGSFGKGRQKFIKELEKLSQLDYSAIVIEASQADLLIPPGRSLMNPKSVVSSLLSWSVRYKINIFFCDTRNLAQATTRKLLLNYFHEARKDYGKVYF